MFAQPSQCIVMRMQPRDPKRIEPTLRLIEQLWRQHPDMRLGQLILNHLHPHCECAPLYFMEDDTLLRYLGVPNPPATRPALLTIDCSNVQTEQEVHEAFAEALSFPGYYGFNWDAFWDILTDHGYFPPAISISGRTHLLAHLPGTVAQLEHCFSELRSKFPDDAVEVTWT